MHRASSIFEILDHDYYRGMIVRFSMDIDDYEPSPAAIHAWFADTGTKLQELEPQKS